MQFSFLFGKSKPDVYFFTLEGISWASHLRFLKTWYFWKVGSVLFSEILVFLLDYAPCSFYHIHNSKHGQNKGSFNNIIHIRKTNLNNRSFYWEHVSYIFLDHNCIVYKDVHLDLMKLVFSNHNLQKKMVDLQSQSFNDDIIGNINKFDVSLIVDIL